MRTLKGLTVAVIAAAAMLAFGAGSASAAELYSTGATLKAPVTFHISLEPGATSTHGTTDGTSIIQTCTGSRIEGATTNTETPIAGHIGALTWSGCSFTVDTLTNGSLSISGAGIVSGSGTVWTYNIGVSCRYGTGGGTTLGTLTTGKLAVNAVINEQEPKQFLCPDTTKWVANYVVTSPHDLIIK